MAPIASELETWKHAYRVLNAPSSASPSVIKQNYRTLIKRWHPDRFITGSTEQAEATNMTRLINEAYACIARAPLRYYTESQPPSSAHRRQDGPTRTQPSPWTVWRDGSTPSGGAKTAARNDSDPYPNADRLEFWVRLFMGIAFGAFFGFVVSLELFLNVGTSLQLGIVAGIVVTALFTVGSVRQGDKFWHSVFGSWVE